MELLVRVGVHVDASRFFAAVQRAAESFPSACGRRVGMILEPGALRVSHVHVSDKAPIADADLFEPQSADNESSMPLRLTTRATQMDSADGDDGAGSSTVGVTWDHALTDVGGAALFLAHVSALYCEAPLPATLTTPTLGT